MDTTRAQLSAFSCVFLLKKRSKVSIDVGYTVTNILDEAIACNTHMVNNETG